jgi:hypothetical protein
MHTEIKGRLNLGNVCHQSVQSLLSSYLLSRNIKVKIYKTIILPVVFNGCETWSLTLWEEHRLRGFENRVLRRIFGPKRDEVMGERRKMQNGSFIICTHHQISLGRSNQGERGRYGMWHSWERTKQVYEILVGMPKRRRPLGRQRCRWEDAIRMDLRETGWGAVEWIHLVQDRDRWWALMNAAINLRVLAPQS